MSPPERAARRPRVAVTGATGFIGRALLPVLDAAGWDLRILARRDPGLPEGSELLPEVVPGGLEDAQARAALLDGVDAVVHLAGVVKAPTLEGYLRINAHATEALAKDCARLAPEAHFLLVSSLAARAPELSDYAASKRAGEERVRAALDGRLSVLRPAAVYGPGDRETLIFFQLARQRLVPLPAPAARRATLIHVSDLARLIAGMLSEPPTGRVQAAADGKLGGYRWDEILGAAAEAVGNPRARLLPAPSLLLKGVAAAGDAARWFGQANMLTSQKLRELRYDDWALSEDEVARPAGWAPEYDVTGGFRDAVAWYRAAGWLSAG